MGQDHEIHSLTAVIINTCVPRYTTVSELSQQQHPSMDAWMHVYM